MTLAAIHQPNFLPWLGYFDKIRQAKVFIILDDVQFPKTGAGTWVNRVQLLIAGGARWVTVPIVRAYHGTMLISDMRINEGSPWRDKLLRTIELNYRRAKHFDVVFPWLSSIIQLQTSSLIDYNLNAIRTIASAVRVDPAKLVLSSSLSISSNSTDRLIDLVRAVGADSYLAGGGAQGYQQDGLFEQASIELVYQNFWPPTYAQRGATQFVPGLSIVDALLNCGFEGTAELLHRGQAR